MNEIYCGKKNNVRHVDESLYLKNVMFIGRGTPCDHGVVFNYNSDKDKTGITVGVDHNSIASGKQ